MIMVDSRVGSAEFAGAFKKMGLRVDVTRLECGDFAFEGCGPDGKDVLIGIERKTIRDMLGSIRSERFSGHQLPSMLKLYDFNYLLLEGQYKRGVCGTLQSWMEKGPFSRWIDTKLGKVGPVFQYSELQKFLFTVQTCTPMNVVQTVCDEETVHTVFNLYQWWQKPWEKHRAHMSLDATPIVMMPHIRYIRLAAAQIKGVGWEKSKGIAKQFKSMEALVEAGPSDIAQCEGIGKTLAERIFWALRGKE